MSYVLNFSESAADDLDKVPDSVAADVAVFLSRLGESPSSLSRSAVFPYPEKGMVAVGQFPLPNGNVFKVSVHFHYRTDEQTLDVFGVGYGELEVYRGDDDAT